MRKQLRVPLLGVGVELCFIIMVVCLGGFTLLFGSVMGITDPAARTALEFTDIAFVGLSAATMLGLAIYLFASRAQLVDEVVAPALAAGRWVLADRFTDASYAYQGAGRGLDPGWIAELERRVVGVRPDLTLWLDLPVETGLQRARQRGGEADRIESERVEFFERVREGYARLAAADPARVVRVDASQPAEQVAADAVRAIRRRWFSERTRA